MSNVTQTPIRMPLWQPLFIFLVFLLSAQKIQAQCTCTGNLVANPSFESGTTSWTWSGGNFNAGTGAVKCGSKSGDFEITNTSSNSVYQVIGTDLAVGTVVNASVWAGTHNNSYSHKVFIHFYNASNVYMSTGSVEVEVDKVLANSPTGPQLYNLSATVPSGAKFTRIGFKGTGNWIKTDMWCVTTSTPPTCNAKVTSLYFNKLDGGTDIPITNGSSFTSAQLGSLYNMEAGTTGTVGSVKFTISGPTATSNIENTAPYNSPGTGSGAWTGAAGSYSVNLKTYSAADGTGTLCHDTTIAFTLTNDCSCPANVLTNGSFENSSSGWSVSGGSLTFGQSYVMCGSYNGFLNHSSGTAKVWQDVTVAAGDVLSFKGYAGTHNPGLACSPKLSLIFYNSSNAVISQADANVTYDVGSGNQLALYTINATAPAGTVKVRVQGSITCNTLKVDGFCLTVTPGTPNCVNSNETFPNQFNTGFNVNLNSTFTGSIGTWSATSNAGATIVVTTPYYSPSTSHAIKIVNWKTNGTNNGFTGTGTATATSPTVNLSSGVCCPASLEMIFTLWTYTCTSGDNKASVALQFYNGTSWVTVWTKTSGELFTAYGANGKTNITVPVPAAYQNSSFKYRFTGTSTTGNANNFYLFIDDIKISSTPCPTSSLGDFVWQDLDSDGQQDAGEPGIPNVTVTLRNSSNVVVGTTTTNASGAYLFTGLSAGTYSVTFDTPAGYAPTPVVNNETAGDALDSDPVGGVVAGIVVPAGTSNTTIDAGFVRLVNISGNVWHDVNAMSDNLVNNTGPLTTPPSQLIPANLNAFLIDDATGLVVAVESVDPFTGTFFFGNVMPNKDYRVLISQFYVDPGFLPPLPVLPTGWQHTGQNLGLGSGHDGFNEGILYFSVETTDVNNVNFGIKIIGGDIVIG